MLLIVVQAYCKNIKNNPSKSCDAQIALCSSFLNKHTLYTVCTCTVCTLGFEIPLFLNLSHR
jgi:hypothetical protein